MESESSTAVLEEIAETSTMVRCDCENCDEFVDIHSPSTIVKTHLSQNGKSRTYYYKDAIHLNRYTAD